ncbi:hypothetical protein LOTGIDRAFT_155631 [Lottia gigantea]|uniref:Uncharacterized protein n=1 Tax=Lottia gigantea TaxID=225164 RepID=V3ZEU0_LOTGI|nr:hypothetical protein LOTGIDRAFT_155631 [Lottia gigantea]ESO82617.1 hypothetical protein LOTGIDRAFT_155631 [Lottia gigantea]
MQKCKYHVSLQPVSNWGFPANTHPILLELGKELNCGPTMFKFLQTNFMEGKFDIPFVKIAGKEGTYNMKEIVYVDSRIQSMGAELTYKLNSRKADMKMTDEQYTILHSDSKLDANITTDGFWGSIRDYPQFDIYQEILKQRWFGKDINTCGVHTYDFDNTLLRPVQVQFQATESIFNKYFPTEFFYVESLQNPLGAVEAFLNFTIASPQNC